jgi:hypothetical protein
VPTSPTRRRDARIATWTFCGLVSALMFYGMARYQGQPSFQGQPGGWGSHHGSRAVGASRPNRPAGVGTAARAAFRDRR